MRLRDMRYINDIIIHCTATPAGIEVGLRELERRFRSMGYPYVGYHYVVHLDGSVDRCRYISQPGAHCRGHNSHSIAVAYVGGTDKDGNLMDTRTDEQKTALLRLVVKLVQLYRCSVHGHRDYHDTECPGYDVHKDYDNLVHRLLYPQK